MVPARAYLTSNESGVSQMRASTVDIRRILVPTDFSEVAFSAVETAVKVAQEYDAIITLAHASSAVPFAAGEAVIPDLLVDQLADDEERMRVLVERLPALAHLHVETVVEYDAAVPMIHDLVRARRPDLVVVGSSGTGGIERVTLGSVAESVARTLPVPVLIMGPRARCTRRPFESIVFATDMKSTALRAAQYASSIAERFHSRLAVLHVVEEEQPVSAIRAELDDRLREELKAIMPSALAEHCAPDFVVSYGSVAEQILELARSRNATLLVLGARHRALLEDHLPWMTLSRTVRGAACGVLVVHDRVS